MQQEAVRRAQEMQRRAQAVRREGAQQREDPEPLSSEIPVTEAEPPDAVPENKNTVFNKPPEHSLFEKSASGGIFDTLFKDKEKTLILGILLLLMDEKTDNSLIMALMYLLI